MEFLSSQRLSQVSVVNFPESWIKLSLGESISWATYGKIFCDIVKNWKESTFSIIGRVKALLIIHTVIMIKLLLYNFEDHVITWGKSF